MKQDKSYFLQKLKVTLLITIYLIILRLDIVTEQIITGKLSDSPLIKLSC